MCPWVCECVGVLMCTCVSLCMCPYTYVCTRVLFLFLFLGRGKCFMHRRYCVPVCRTVLHVPTKTLTSSSSSFSVFSLRLTRNRCCWSLRLSALLLLFSESLHSRCGETSDRRLLFLRCQHQFYEGFWLRC